MVLSFGIHQGKRIIFFQNYLHIDPVLINLTGFFPICPLFCIGKGWSSPAVNLLTSEGSPLPSGQITMNQASWVVSLEAAGALIGNMLIGYVAKQFGRKRPLHLFTIPLIVSRVCCCCV